MLSSHPPDCPGWNYDKLESGEHRPDFRNTLRAGLKRVLLNLRANSHEGISRAQDLRSDHKAIFRSLTDPGFEYFSGNYRGAEYRCLKHYNVMIANDPAVGSSADNVEQDMMLLAETIRHRSRSLDVVRQRFLSGLSEKERVLLIVEYACDCFVRFLTIHPFADGNGHAGRLLVWWLLGYFDLWPVSWSVDPRPRPSNQYVDAIVEWRAGNRAPLVRMVLSCL